MTVIDATDLILGRMATHVAKRAMLGETMNVVNCEKAVISGSKSDIFARYRERLEKGSQAKGPFFPRKVDVIVRRAIRGMIPYKQGKGILAFRRVQCFIGVPEELAKEKPETIKEANVSKLSRARYTPLSEIGIYLGGKL
jgi:large subunit ribosomal protein L13